MNTIKAKQDKNDYEIYSDYLNFRIDDFWLDEKLENFYPEEMYKGLIPTLSFAMEIEAESKVVWSRILPKENTKTICPILMCPDDNDFSCTIILAEIETSKNKISWNRIGIDQTKEFEPEKIGSEVIWLEKVKPFDFVKSNYIEMITDFKKQFIIDKDDWKSRNTI